MISVKVDSKNIRGEHNYLTNFTGISNLIAKDSEVLTTVQMK